MPYVENDPSTWAPGKYQDQVRTFIEYNDITQAYRLSVYSWLSPGYVSIINYKTVDSGESGRWYPLSTSSHTSYGEACTHSIAAQSKAEAAHAEILKKEAIDKAWRYVSVDQGESKVHVSNDLSNSPLFPHTKKKWWRK